MTEFEQLSTCGTPYQKGEPCGCQIMSGEYKLSPLKIEYCPTHKDAPDLFELAVATLSYCQDDSRSEQRRQAMIAAAKEAIAEAQPK